MQNRAMENKLYYESPSNFKQVQCNDLSPNSELATRLNGYLYMSQVRPFQVEMNNENQNERNFINHTQEEKNALKEREFLQTPYFGALYQQQQMLTPNTSYIQQQSNYQASLLSSQQRQENFQQSNESYLYSQQTIPSYWENPNNENKALKKEIKRQFGEVNDIPLGSMSPCPHLIQESGTDNVFQQQHQYQRKLTYYYPSQNGAVQNGEEYEEVQM